MTFNVFSCVDLLEANDEFQKHFRLQETPHCCRRFLPIDCWCFTNLSLVAENIMLKIMFCEIDNAMHQELTVWLEKIVNFLCPGCGHLLIKFFSRCETSRKYMILFSRSGGSSDRPQRLSRRLFELTCGWIKTLLHRHKVSRAFMTCEKWPETVCGPWFDGWDTLLSQSTTNWPEIHSDVTKSHVLGRNSPWGW